MKHLLTAGIAAIGLLSGANAVEAATANTVFVIDNSGSMGGEIAWLTGTVLSLDAELALAGIDTRTYGTVSFGGSALGGDPINRTGATGSGVSTTLVDAATASTDIGAIPTGGGFEDGYEAIMWALNNLMFDAGAALNIVLVTDEDRDVGSSDTYASTLAALEAKNALLNVVVDADIEAPGPTACIGVDSEGGGYVEDGFGDYISNLSCLVTSGFGTTTTDYTPMALATGGAVWDLNQLRAGGLTADSFTAAFVDIKVKEIKQQVNPIPLPAAAWLLMAGVAGLAVAGRRKKAA